MFRHKTDTKTLHSHELTCDTLGRAGQTRLTCAPEWDRGSVLAPWTRWLPSSTSFAPPPPPDCFTLQLLGNIHLLLPPPKKRLPLLRLWSLQKRRLVSEQRSKKLCCSAEEDKPDQPASQGKLWKITTWAPHCSHSVRGSLIWQHSTISSGGWNHVTPRIRPEKMWGKEDPEQITQLNDNPAVLLVNVMFLLSVWFLISLSCVAALTASSPLSPPLSPLTAASCAFKKTGCFFSALHYLHNAAGANNSKPPNNRGNRMALFFPTMSIYSFISFMITYHYFRLCPDNILPSYLYVAWWKCYVFCPRFSQWKIPAHSMVNQSVEVNKRLWGNRMYMEDPVWVSEAQL